jgi:carboxyl-terminal processing protease
MNWEKIRDGVTPRRGQGPVPDAKRRTWPHLLKMLLVGLLLFTAGWATGSGRISLSGYTPVSQNRRLPSALDYSSVNDIYGLLRQKFDGKLDEAALLDGIKSGLTKAAGDPYTEYFSPADAEEFNNELSGTFEGIGAELGKDENKNIIIISPLAGFPADKAGLKPKDIIAEIDGQSAYDLPINQAVNKIRGPGGTQVKLKVVRSGELKEFTITREQINVPSVKSEIRENIGILTISRFGDDTFTLAEKAANEFKAAGVKGVVLDLRGNPGGYLESAVSVSSLWLQDRTVLTERRENVVIETIKSHGLSPLNGIKTVVLVDGGSASASEIMAGALKDNGAATIYGEKSFGKGSVQEPLSLANGGLLKITIARWYTPNGKNIDKEGITPDKEVKAPEDEPAGQDAQLDAAVAALR